MPEDVWMYDNKQASEYEYVSYNTYPLYKLKLVTAIFYQIFIFHQMITLRKLWKMFFV